jgi:dTDP-4-amino-4,6-dideoxygalactose transaminase
MRLSSCFRRSPRGRAHGSLQSGTRHAYHLYQLLIDGEQSCLARDDFLDAMTASGIGVGVPLFEHPPNTRSIKSASGGRPEGVIQTPWPLVVKTVSLPIGANLSDASLGRITEAVICLLHGV